MRKVMAASHLTQGGFYRHFASMDELVAEAF
jgi:AcrR family transcriptional regulator